MGKASKWIRSFLMGKRGNKDNNDNKEIEIHPPNIIKRRWSFRRSTSSSTSRDESHSGTRGARLISTTHHKSTRSFDSINLIPKQAFFEYHHSHTAAHDAATRIQAVYRSYLARRALRALKGLVKLQALARGYLVRKQINLVVRSMHAVMAIQVRARIHRVQMAGDETVPRSRKSNAQCVQRIQGSVGSNLDVENSYPIFGSLGTNRSGGKNDKVCNYGRRLSVSQREYQLKKYHTDPSTDSASSTITYDGQQQDEELSLKMEHSIYSAWPDINNEQPFIALDYAPSYMSNTKSSTAKTRSHSEPRRRPKFGAKQRSSTRRSSSMDGKDDKVNKHTCLMIRLNSSEKYANQGHHDYNTSGIESRFPFEPPVNLY